MMVLHSYWDRFNSVQQTVSSNGCKHCCRVWTERKSQMICQNVHFSLNHIRFLDLGFRAQVRVYSQVNCKIGGLRAQGLRGGGKIITIGLLLASNVKHICPAAELSYLAQCTLHIVTIIHCYCCHHQVFLQSIAFVFIIHCDDSLFHTFYFVFMVHSKFEFQNQCIHDICSNDMFFLQNICHQISVSAFLCSCSTNYCSTKGLASLSSRLNLLPVPCKRKCK